MSDGLQRTLGTLVVSELTKLADHLSPPAGAGTDHAIRCECWRCIWADDIRAGLHLIEQQADRLRAAEARAERYRKALAELVRCIGDGEAFVYPGDKWLAAIEAARTELRGEG